MSIEYRNQCIYSILFHSPHTKTLLSVDVAASQRVTQRALYISSTCKFICSTTLQSTLVKTPCNNLLLLAISLFMIMCIWIKKKTD